MGPSPTDRLTPSPSVATTPALLPHRAIGVERGELVEIEIPSGRSVRELDTALGPAGLGEGVGSLTYSEARDSLLLSRVITAAEQEIVEVPLDGGQAKVVAHGHAAAPAPDGERFAVARREPGEQGSGREVLEVRTFAGQVAGRWVDPVRPEEPVSVSHLSWSPDGRQVAFELRLEDGTETRVMDVAAEDGSLQSVSQRVEPLGDLRLLSAPEFRPDDGALVAVDGPGLDPDAQQSWRVVVLTAAPGAGDVLAEADRAITRLDFDRTGKHLLYVLRHAHPPRDGDSVEPSQLVHVHDGASSHVRRDMTHVAW